MQLHQLKPTHQKKERQRIGRGGKKGTYSGRGIKGQMSRAGRKPRPGFSGGDTPLLKRFPKKRGSVGKVNKRRGVKLARLKTKITVLALREIEKKFKEGEIVSPQSLLEKGIISRMKKRMPVVKILAIGQAKKKLEFKGVRLTKNIKAK